MYDQDYKGVAGMNFPENGKILYKQDFAEEQSGIGEEVVDRESDIISRGVIEGFDVTVSSTAGCVDITAGSARDSLGRRVTKAAVNAFPLPDIQTVKLVARHVWTYENYIPDGSAETKIRRKHSAEIATIPDAQALSDREVGLFKVTRSGATVTIVEDLRSFAQIRSRVFSFTPILPATDPTLDNHAVRKAYVDSQILKYLPISTILPFAGFATPPGWLKPDGSSLLRATYASFFNVISQNKGTFTVTIATPAVFTLNNHGLQTGDCISLTSTGSLPGGLSVDYNYYVIYLDATTFRLANSYANAIAATPVPINTSGTQSGTHSLRYNPWGINGALSFYLPDLRGLGLVFAGQQATAAWASANYAAVLGAYIQDKFQRFKARLYVEAHNGTNGGTGSFATYTQQGESFYIANSFAQDFQNDGYGDPRTGFTTHGPVAGVNAIIRVA